MAAQLGYPHWLTIGELQRVADGGEQVFLEHTAWERIETSRQILERYTSDRLPIYGVNTQFGDDAYRVVIEGDYESYLASVVDRQNNVMRALGCGLGPEYGRDIARATMTLRIHTLAQGCSGVRCSLIERLLKLLQADVLPPFYRYGSVGASGDLIPLSAIARLVMGEGEARVDTKTVAAIDALSVVQLSPELLSMKEGLAIVNGTSFMTGLSALAVSKLQWLLPMSVAAGAACVEAMLGMDSPYSDFVHRGKHHKGQVHVAQFVRHCWSGSSLIRKLDELRQEWRSMILSSGRAEQENVQDYYSLRAIAHGFGPFCDDVERAIQWVENEMNSLNDNPLIDPVVGDVHSSANFMGDYVAVICDHLRADVAKAGTWLHALFGNIVNPRKSRGLPSCLVRDPDAVTGFKTVQLLVASLVVENRTKCLPLSAVMLPTEADNQDMVSLGTHSASQLLDAVENFQLIVTIMLMVAAQALELRDADRVSEAGKTIIAFVRQVSPFLDRDRSLRDEMIALNALLPTCTLAKRWFST